MRLVPGHDPVHDLVEAHGAGVQLRGILGPAERAFYHGHSYTANPLGCAAALASQEVFEREQTLALLPAKIAHLRAGLAALQAAHPIVHDVRQCGFVAGIEIRQPDGRKFPPDLRRGEAICRAARAHGLLTRPILDTIVLMPPLTTTTAELDHALAALAAAFSINPGIDTCPATT